MSVLHLTRNKTTAILGFCHSMHCDVTAPPTLLQLCVKKSRLAQSGMKYGMIVGKTLVA